MSIHPIVNEVVRYPETLGKKVALKFYRWQSLDKVEELFAAENILKLARMIDALVEESKKPKVCAVLSPQGAAHV